MKRRKFLIQTGTVAAGCMAGGMLPNRARAAAATSSAGKGVSIVCNPSDAVASSAPAQWAVGQLQEALTARGLAVKVVKQMDEVAPGDDCLVAAGAATATRDFGLAALEGPEALALGAGKFGTREVQIAAGSDARGLVYALTEIADAVRLADSMAVLPRLRPVMEAPANRVRSVMRLFASDVEDKSWFNDRDFWRRYLSLLVTQRFNRFNLALGLGYDAPSGLTDTYMYFAYPFLVSVPGYDVRATNLPDAERDQNLAMLRFISDEAAARGLQFQLGLWTHAYEWINSPKANHNIEGLTPQTQAPYSRDALAVLLKECPNITGVTFRIHGESGVPEGSYDLWKTIFDGCVRSGRRIEIDMHAKGMDQPTIDAAMSTGLPVAISPKFWAEHMGLPYHQAAIRPTELPTRQVGAGPYAQSSGARSFLRYGYGDLMKASQPYSIFYRTWPGTQRMLLWGDPVFAAAYSRAGNFGGATGHEIFDPLSFKGRKGSGRPGGRDGYTDVSLRPAGGDFEKFTYTYRLWGRLLYNPNADAEIWQRQLRQDYGGAAGPVEISLGAASRILPLLTTAHLPSAANNNFWPEMYINMSIVDAAHPEPYTDTPTPKRFGTVSPLDPELFSRMDDYAADLLKGSVGAKYSPVEVAQWLEDLATTAADNLAAAQPKTADHNAPAFRRFAIDTETQIGLGRFFGQKMRAGVLYSLYERTGDSAVRDAAVKTYRAAREAWARIAEVTTGVYAPEITYGDAWFQHGHWSDRLTAIDNDIAAMERVAVPPTASAGTPEALASLVTNVLGRPKRAEIGLTHAPPADYLRTQPVTLDLVPAGGTPLPAYATLHYRHVNQAESWLSQPMQVATNVCRATIPGDYTDSPYALQYYFEVPDISGRPALFPGLPSSLFQPADPTPGHSPIPACQPYFVLG